jgi:hypothetical protein
MLRFASVLALLFAVAGLTLSTGAFAAEEKKAEEKKTDEKKTEKKEVTLTGKITCAKCDLGETDKCATVIKVDKEVYYFDADSNKKYHKDICQAGKDGTVTVTVKEEEKKKIIAVTKLEYKK